MGKDKAGRRDAKDTKSGPVDVFSPCGIDSGGQVVREVSSTREGDFWGIPGKQQNLQCSNKLHRVALKTCECHPPGPLSVLLGWALGHFLGSWCGTTIIGAVFQPFSVSAGGKTNI